LAVLCLGCSGSDDAEIEGSPAPTIELNQGSAGLAKRICDLMTAE
jgi:hypothetical protein